MSQPPESRRPNILLVMTDQLHYPPAYESDELAAYRREHCAGQERLRANGVSFKHHYPISSCLRAEPRLAADGAPSLAARRVTDARADQERRRRRHVLAGA